ncbi:unnamed protein product [Darwinula stevensoni]|uniref:Adt-1/2-like domain-containing protein n=1 Tax=Darwinula stevensoni TaxID=69355 RepID=A0A7R9AE07_9CRUS|nr:unnamed protein product [Darwinula stevensoni]CAG0901203.1 unnamed protein product [Darwinula stevensoni]
MVDPARAPASSIGLSFTGLLWSIPSVAVQPKDACKLFCQVSDSNAYYLLQDKVIDGTTCGPDTNDICVNGICKPAGCDHILDSNKQTGLAFPVSQPGIPVSPVLARSPMASIRLVLCTGFEFEARSNF